MPLNKETQTVIPVERMIQQRLVAAKRGRETYSEVIDRLLRPYERRREKSSSKEARAG